MNDNLLTGILIFGVMQSLFFALLFSTKKEKSLPNKILGIWLLILAIQTFLIVVIMETKNNTIFDNSPLIITLLYGPFLFLYVSKLTHSKSILTPIDYIHFIPFILFLLVSFIFPTDRSLFIKLLSGVSCLSGITYCFITHFLLRIHKNNIENKFSNVENITLAWVSKLVNGLLFIWSGVFVLVILYRFLHIELSLNWFFVIIPLFIFYLGYYGIKQQVIFANVQEYGSENSQKIRKVQRSYENSYKKSSLLPDKMKAIYDKLINCMQNDKLYLNPVLSLNELSETVNIPSHHITQTLNEYAKINFYDFINNFRIEAFKRIIESEDAEKYSLLGIALDCGFNSKSSFNRIFKNFTGQSPSEYKNFSTKK